MNLLRIQIVMLFALSQRNFYLILIIIFDLCNLFDLLLIVCCKLFCNQRSYTFTMHL